MAFSEIVGSVSHHLREEMLSSRVVHAYLLTGPAGTGKRTLADICARALFCQSAGERPCDACPACRQLLSGNHPDFIRLRPEKSIGVNDVRAVIERLSVKPYEADRHVVVVEQADKMTPQAQNALLKTLETPPGPDVFFLIAGQMTAMLPTIVSRCRMVRFHYLEPDEAETALKAHGLPEDRARLLARLSQGSVGRALAMNESDAWWALREKVIASLAALHEKQDVAVAALPLAEKREQASDILDILELCARDLMVIQDAGGGVVQTDIEEKLAQLRFTGSRALRGVMEARRMLASNVAWQSALEMLFFNMAGG
ncbi:MAG: DNA polymerase III subunit delta' [Clostridia bacterium]|nr:DNA polymerase III subunit delta' [Clostridia bacterium]